jgi:hypothetical protein
MREIKFRAWDGDKKIITQPQDLSCCRSSWSWLGLKDMPLMQYTGLKDKNGKEIYEGDICFIDNIQNFEVIWSRIGFWFKREDGELFVLTPQNAWIEVIGNIYENPELLGKDGGMGCSGDRNYRVVDDGKDGEDR